MPDEKKRQTLICLAFFKLIWPEEEDSLEADLNDLRRASCFVRGGIFNDLPNCHKRALSEKGGQQMMQV